MTHKLKRDLIACAVAFLIVSYFFVFWRGAESVGPAPDWSTDMMAAPDGVTVVVQFAVATIDGKMAYRTMDAERGGDMWFHPKLSDLEGYAFKPINLEFVVWTFPPPKR